jgi:ribosomal protein L11 methylase PrmA
MEHKKKLEELNKESLAKLEEYVKSKEGLQEEHHEKLHQAKEEWQGAWNKLMDVLMVLERLEI